MTTTNQAKFEHSNFFFYKYLYWGNYDFWNLKMKTLSQLLEWLRSCRAIRDDVNRQAMQT